MESLSRKKLLAQIEEVILQLGNETLQLKEDDPKYLDKVNAIHFKMVSLSNIRTVLIRNVTDDNPVEW